MVPIEGDCPKGQHSEVINRLENLEKENQHQWNRLEEMSGRPSWFVSVIIALLASSTTFFATYWMAGIKRDVETKSALAVISNRLESVEDSLVAVRRHIDGGGIIR